MLPAKPRRMPRLGRLVLPALARREQAIPIARLPESGRGLAVMRACVDQVTLHSQPGRGTVVIMHKHISWSQDAPLRQLQTVS